MVNNNLVNELREALARGETLKQAMSNLKKSLLEKSYTEEEIAEAAEALRKEGKKLMTLVSGTKKSKSNVIIILEGLRVALITGDSLKQAMISFYNAGYKKEEIEQAARELQIERHGQSIQQRPLQKQVQKKIEAKPKTIQKVSDYSSYPIKGPKSKGKIILIFFITLLVILLGSLLALFLFKEQVLDFFDKSSFFSGLFG